MPTRGFEAASTATLPRLIIFGSGGHSRVAADIARLMQCWTEVVFYDDRLGEGRSFEALCSLPPESAEVFVAIGGNALRETMQSRLETLSFSVATLIHPASVQAQDSSVGAGSLLAAGAILNPGARMGRGCILNTAASADHDCMLGDFVHVSPGVRLAGTVTVADRTWLGIGSVVIEGRTIGKDVMVAAGAVVTRDVDDNRKVMGVPAR